MYIQAYKPVKSSMCIDLHIGLKPKKNLTRVCQAKKNTVIVAEIVQWQTQQEILCTCIVYALHNSTCHMH